MRRHTLLRLSFFVSLLALFNGCFNYVKVDPFPASPDNRKLGRVVLDGADEKKGCFSGGGSDQSILLIPIEGVIKDDGIPAQKSVSPAWMKHFLDMAAKDRSVKAILLKISSPGGSVSGSDLIYRMIREYARIKQLPVYAHIEGLGASGAYYIAMSSKTLNTSPTATVGSIGVILRSFNVKALMDKLGVEYTGIKSGDNKDMLSPFTERNVEQEKMLKEQIMSAYENFLSIILKGRLGAISEKKLRSIADGRIFNAEQAKKLGLVDSVAYMDEFIQFIRRKENLPDSPVISYLPVGKTGYNLYDTSSAGPASLPEALMQLTGLSRSGLFYLMQ